MSFDDALLAKSQRMADPVRACTRASISARQPTSPAKYFDRHCTPKEPLPSHPSNVEQAIDFLRERADIPEQVADQLRKNMPVSPKREAFRSG
jgi:hypothetical protein